MVPAHVTTRTTRTHTIFTLRLQTTGDRLRIHQYQRILKTRRPHHHATRRIEHHALAIKDQLVIPSHLISVEEPTAVAAGNTGEELEPVLLLAHMIWRCGEVHHHLSTGLYQLCHGVPLIKRMGQIQ